MEYEILLKKDAGSDWAVSASGLMSTDEVHAHLRELHTQYPAGRAMAVNVFAGKPYFAV